MALHLELGRNGEELAAAYLEKAGYRILERNWRQGRAEIDLIAWYAEKIIFVEVKTRSNRLYGEPEEAVDWRKERQLQMASSVYISRMRHQGEIRFDIVAIVFENKDLYHINHIEDAFWPG